MNVFVALDVCVAFEAFEIGAQRGITLILAICGEHFIADGFEGWNLVGLLLDQTHDDEAIAVRDRLRNLPGSQVRGSFDCAGTEVFAQFRQRKQRIRHECRRGGSS